MRRRSHAAGSARPGRVFLRLPHHGVKRQMMNDAAYGGPDHDLDGALKAIRRWEP